MRLALVPVVIASVLSAACGGSSSETPFPLEPDFARLDAGGPPRNARYVVFTGSKAREQEREGEGDAAPPEER